MPIPCQTTSVADHYCRIATRAASYQNIHPSPEPSGGPILDIEPAEPRATPKFLGAGAAARRDAVDATGQVWLSMMAEARDAQATSLFDFTAQADPNHPGNLCMQAMLPGTGEGIAIELSIFDRRAPFTFLMQWMALKLLGQQQFTLLQAERALAMCAREEPAALATRNQPFPEAWLAFDERRVLLAGVSESSGPKRVSKRI